MRSHDTSLGGGGRTFPETVWDVLSRITSSSPEERRGAFEELCRRYWKPAYSYLRMGRGKSSEDAKDLTQAFFVWLFEEGDVLARFDPERGRFRAFLKGVLRHFAQHQDKTMSALKRGGSAAFVPLGDGEVPTVGASEDPEGAFDAAWRAEVLERAVDAVRARLLAAGQGEKMRAFEEYDCVAPDARPSYDALGKKIGLSADTVKSYLRQVRQAVRAQIREELSRTTTTREELDDEWNAFFQA
jgi:RNA polymerase sigma factor (sigma-70 family)